MILERNRENLSDDIFSLFGTTEEDQILEVFKKKLKEKIDYINDLINVDLDKLTNVEFYYLIRRLYGITLEEKDFLAFVSKKRNKEYTMFKTIPTTMVFQDYKKEGTGSSFDYWKQPYQIFIEAALSHDTKLDSKKNYTSTDIKNMSENNEITVLDYQSLELEDYISDIEILEEYPVKELKLAKSIVPNNEEYKDEFDYYMTAIRRVVNKPFILRDLRKYVKELNDELYDVFIYSSMSFGYGEIAKKCKEWFKQENISDELKNISKRLSKRYN